MWRGCRELNSDLKVRSLDPHPLDHIPTLEAAERFELSSSEVEARRIVPLCYAASLLCCPGAGCGNRTHFVSLKRRVHMPSLPVTHVQHQSGAGCWNRTNASRLSTAGSTFELILQIKWCAVRELNPHLLGVGPLFWSVELPARKTGTGYRSRTCLAA